jgi:DNA invertase Pin-like site-specific DNA recombinase
MEQYVTYYRVSTKGQGKSGNGLEAQRTAVKYFLSSRNAQEVDSFTEVESGRNGNRPILEQAVQRCKDTGAKLLVAKLDSLTRNVAFLFKLKEELESAGVGFVFADLPEASNIMVLGIIGLVAQYEAELISRRTKEGLAEARRKGKQIGGTNNLTDADRRKAWASISRNARTDEDSIKAFHFIEAKRREGLSYQAIADQLNKFKYRTRKGKKFHPAQVRKLYIRFTNQNNDGDQS